MAEVPGAKVRVALVQLACERYVFELQRPHFNVETGQEPEAGCEFLVPEYRPVGMQELLNHLRRGAEWSATPEAFVEERSRRLSQGMWRTNRVDEDVRVDEDHVSVAPLLREALITFRCSSQSGSRSGPA